MWKGLTKRERGLVVAGIVVVLLGAVAAITPVEIIPLEQKAPIMALAAGTLLAIIYMPVKPVEPKDIPRSWGRMFVALAGIASAWFWLYDASNGQPFQSLLWVGIATVILSLVVILWLGLWLLSLRIQSWVKAAWNWLLKGGNMHITIGGAITLAVLITVWAIVVAMSNEAGCRITEESSYMSGPAKALVRFVLLCRFV